MSDAVNDGVRTHHGGLAKDELGAHEALQVIAEMARTPVWATFRVLHDQLAALDALEVADEISAGVRGLDRGNVRRTALWLVENGTRRNAVAIGLVLLGLSGDERDRDTLLLLGSLETLTLYAVVALRRSQPDPETAVFELARRVRGWGRIHCVERLVGTGDVEIKQWLLRGGFHNGVLDDYLAYIAATTGGLADALDQSEVDDELLDSAGEIILAMRPGGPAKDMTDYADGPRVTDRYLQLVRERPPTLARAATVLAVGAFPDMGPAWTAVVQEALDDPQAYRRAIGIAEALGLPYKHKVPGWLVRDPYRWNLWRHVPDVDTLVDLADRLLPLADLATGPTTEIGLGHEYDADESLVAVVDVLADHPGTGWRFVRAALANRTVRARFAAVRTLTAWPRSEEADEAVRTALAVEPEDQVRADLEAYFTR
jgi:hypothetical protein